MWAGMKLAWELDIKHLYPHLLSEFERGESVTWDNDRNEIHIVTSHLETETNNYSIVETWRVRSQDGKWTNDSDDVDKFDEYIVERGAKADMVKIQFMAESIDNRQVNCLSCGSDLFIASAFEDAACGVSSTRPSEWLTSSSDVFKHQRRDRLIDVFCCASCGTMNKLMYRCSGERPCAWFQTSSMTQQDMNHPLTSALSLYLLVPLSRIVVDFLPLFGDATNNEEFTVCNFSPEYRPQPFREFGDGLFEDDYWLGWDYISNKFERYDELQDAQLTCLVEGDDVFQLLDSFNWGFDGCQRLFYTSVGENVTGSVTSACRRRFRTVFGADHLQHPQDIRCQCQSTIDYHADYEQGRFLIDSVDSTGEPCYCSDDSM